MEQNWSYSSIFGQRKSKLTALQKLTSHNKKSAGKGKESHTNNCKSSSIGKKGVATKTSCMTSSVKVEPSHRGRRKLSSKKHGTSHRDHGSFTDKRLKVSNAHSEQDVVDTPLGKCSNPRYVLLRVSDIPLRSRIRSRDMTDTDIDGYDEKDVHHIWGEGHMLWGKLRGYPFWPCMVSRDPFSKLFTKAVGSYNTSRSYHIQFFGAEAERSWINKASLVEFEGREKYLNIVQYGLENPEMSSRTPSEFKISSAWFPVWSLAVAEAEAAFKLNVEERLRQYTFRYVMTQRQEQKPVDDVLGIIWRSAGRRPGMDKDEPGSSDGSLYDLRRERPSYDSDDFYSSDESSSSCVHKSCNRPAKIVAVREGLLNVFLVKHEGYVQTDHPDWNQLQIEHFLRHQWSVMDEHQRSRYTTRHQKPVFVEVRKVKRQISGIADDDAEDVDTDKLNLQILKLSKKGHFVKSRDLCVICGRQGSDLVCCGGHCGKYFHAACSEGEGSDNCKCLECYSGACLCFVCKKSGPDIIQCSQVKCDKYYHEACAATLRMSVFDKDIFVCSLHSCATCVVDCNPDAKEGLLMECVQCPTAYHASDFCVVAGSEVIGQRRRLVCARHFKPDKGQTQHGRVNMRRCLQCGNGDNLLLCQGCPAAYHEGCGGQPSSTPPLTSVVQPRLCVRLGDLQAGENPWLCSRCVVGKSPLYGDIVWVKHGIYRWWPGEVCHPLQVPKKVQDKRHQVGEFPVRFFGSHDFAWLHRGRVLSFDRVTKGCRDTLMGTGDKVFTQGVKEAIAATRVRSSIVRKM